MGPEVGELEERLSVHSGARHVVSCSSGTDALLLVLLAWDIGPGDAVLVPSFTFAATAEAVSVAGATPVFVDISPDTYNIDFASLKAAFAAAQNEDLRPAATIAVDLFGHPAAYNDLHPFCRETGMRLLADAAQSFGGSYGGVPVGRLGDATATSFFPAKPLGCYGDGGAVFTDDDDLAALVSSLRVHGQGADKYSNQRVGLNARLDTLQAAILLEKLTVFDDEVALRQQVAQRYSGALDTVAKVPHVAPDVRSAWAQYTIRVTDRDRVAAEMARASIPTAVYYRNPLHTLPPYETCPRATTGLDVTERVAEDVLSLPMHPYLSEEDQARTIDSIVSAVGGSHAAG